MNLIHSSSLSSWKEFLNKTKVFNVTSPEKKMRWTSLRRIILTSQYKHEPDLNNKNYMQLSGCLLMFIWKNHENPWRRIVSTNQRKDHVHTFQDQGRIGWPIAFRNSVNVLIMNQTEWPIQDFFDFLGKVFGPGFFSGRIIRIIPQTALPYGLRQRNL